MSRLFPLIALRKIKIASLVQKLGFVLLKGLILPIVGVALGRVFVCSLHSRLVSVALAYNGISIIILSKAPDLEYIFRDTFS